MAIEMTRGGSTSALIGYLGVVTVCLAITGPPASAQAGNGVSSHTATHSDAPSRAQSLPVFYDHELAANGFPNPFVRARIAGHEAIFIIDTGSTRHFLGEWYAKVAKIPTTVMKDSKVNGSVVPRMAHHVKGRWSDGQRFTLNEPMVVPFPPYFESHHIGGIISPQFLIPAGMAAVFDLKAPSLRFEPFERALSGLQAANPSAIIPPATPVCHSEVADPLYLVPVTVAGVTDLMTIDTGASKTILSKDSKIAQAIGTASEPGPRTEGLAGELGGQGIVRDVRLLRGGRSISLNPSIGKPSWPCDAQGLLGMDALRSCSLVLDDVQVAITCDGASEPASSVTGQ